MVRVNAAALFPHQVLLCLICAIFETFFYQRILRRRPLVPMWGMIHLPTDERCTFAGWMDVSSETWTFFVEDVDVMYRFPVAFYFSILDPYPA